jgi:hypothetical protein
MIIVSNSDNEKEYDFGDVGPNFTFAQIEALVDETLEDYRVEKRILPGQYDTVIAFLQTSNHERGLREDLFKLLKKLAEFGTGIDAMCRLFDDEANGGEGCIWEVNLRDPDVAMTEFPVKQVDFSKSDWPKYQPPES